MASSEAVIAHTERTGWLYFCGWGFLGPVCGPPQRVDYLAMPELLTRASCSKDWKRTSDGYVMSSKFTTRDH